VRIEHRSGTGGPQPARVGAGVSGSVEQVVGIAATVAPDEPDARGTAADELEIDVPAVMGDVAEKAAETVGVVKA
jgi:hypothetical protein